MCPEPHTGQRPIRGYSRQWWATERLLAEAGDLLLDLCMPYFIYVRTPNLRVCRVVVLQPLTGCCSEGRLRVKLVI